MQTRPLLALAALAAATEPDFGRDALERMKRGFRERYEGDPMGTTAQTVLLASLLFYRAERAVNPKVKTFHDALVYVSTNLSVGFSDIHAQTPAGKTIGSALMTIGPAMANRVLDRPRGERASDERERASDEEGAPDANEAATRDVVDRLDRILAALQAREPGALGAPG